MYRGPTTAGTLHRHAAFQIMIGMRGAVSVVDASDFPHRAAALLVHPMERHCLLATPDVLTYFVEPHCVFADRLRRDYGNAITAAPELCDLSDDDVRPVGSRPSDELDPRLVLALNTLADSTIALPSLAAQVGLSPQRLRVLASSNSGCPGTLAGVDAAAARRGGASGWSVLGRRGDHGGLRRPGTSHPPDARDDGPHARSPAAYCPRSLLARDVDRDRTADRWHHLGLSHIAKPALGQ